MNAKVFKNLIKEAVREAVREEIGVLLLEQKKQELNENKTFSFNSSDIPTGNVEARAALRSKMGSMFGYEQSPSTALRVDPTSDNPFMAFIEDAAANMSPQELSGLRNLG
jgi:hypothetical protein